MTRPESWAAFIGFLAGRQATIHAQIKDWALDDWAAQYMHATDGPMPAEDSGRYTVVQPDTNKWACSASVAFRSSLGELMAAQVWTALPFDVAVKEAANGRMVIYNEDVMWRLFEYGFALGSGQDADRIRGILPPAMHRHFDKGLALAGS